MDQSLSKPRDQSPGRAQANVIVKYRTASETGDNERMIDNEIQMKSTKKEKSIYINNNIS